MTKHETIRRYGVVGAGNQSQYRIPSLMALAGEGFEVAAISDPDLGRAVKVAAQFGIPARYATLTQMIEAERLDGVMILAPHAYHADLSIEAMLAGLDVFCEKPMAVALADCRRMLAVAAENGATLGIGYQYAYWLEWLLEQIATGTIGTVTGARIWWSRADLIPEMPSFWAHPFAGGVSLDLCGHLVTVLRRVLGELRSVWAESSSTEGIRRYGDQFVTEDTIRAKFIAESGARAKLEASWRDGGPPDEEVGLVVYGRHGEINVPFPGPRKDVAALRPVVRRYGPNGGVELGPEPPVYHDVVVEQARDWHRACRDGVAMQFSAHDAYDVERAVHAMRQAATLDGEWVDIASIES
jgi:predicted dehydrogenase